MLVDKQFVFTSRVEALKAAKSFPGSRFKSFTSLQEAEEYANALPVEVPPPSISKVGQLCIICTTVTVGPNHRQHSTFIYYVLYK